MWRPAAADAGRKHQRADGILPEVPEGTTRSRRAPLARRARSAYFRPHLRRRLETLGRTDEDDPQRVPPDAVAEAGTGARAEAHGGLLLRRRRRAPAGVRAAAGQGIRRAAGITPGLPGPRSAGSPPES